MTLLKELFDTYKGVVHIFTLVCLFAILSVLLYEYWLTVSRPVEWETKNIDNVLCEGEPLTFETRTTFNYTGSLWVNVVLIDTDTGRTVANITSDRFEGRPTTRIRGEVIPWGRVTVPLDGYGIKNGEYRLTGRSPKAENVLRVPFTVGDCG